MTRILIIIISIFFLSCNSKQAKKPKVDSTVTAVSKTNDSVLSKEPQNEKHDSINDTTSLDYLTNLLENEMAINYYWTKRLDALDEFALPLDSTRHLAVVRQWTINDSISAIILKYTTGTDYDQFLLTVKNKKDFVSKIHISDNDDSDLSPDNPYHYTEHTFISDRKVKLINHKVVQSENGDETDKVVSVEYWSIKDNGQAIKK